MEDVSRPSETQRQPPMGPASPAAALGEYARALNAIISRAREDTLNVALDEMAHVSAPRFFGFDGAYLRDRKRRELLEQFGLLRHVVVRLRGISQTQWLRFFLSSAEMAGTESLLLRWAEAPRKTPEVTRLTLKNAAALLKTMESNPADAGQLLELSHANAAASALAAVILPTAWLTLSGAPFFVEQAQRELDRLTLKAPLAFSLRYDRSAECQEGDPWHIQAHIRNQSSDVVVLEALANSEDHAADETFHRPSFGHLLYEPARDCFTYQPISQGEGGAIFHTAVLAPGEERLLPLHVQMLASGDRFCEFQLRFRRLSSIDAPRRIYVPFQAPWERYTTDMSYVPWGRAEHLGQPDLSSVILRTNDIPLIEATWAVPVTIQQRAFSLTDAKRRVPDALEAVHFSRWQQGWIFRTKTGCALVSRSRVTEYQRLAPEIFTLVDSLESRVPIRFEPALIATFKALPLGLSDWESHDLGLSATLPKYKLNTLIQETERLGLRLALKRNVVGRETLFVSG